MDWKDYTQVLGGLADTQSSTLKSISVVKEIGRFSVRVLYDKYVSYGVELKVVLSSLNLLFSSCLFGHVCSNSTIRAEPQVVHLESPGLCICRIEQF